MNLIFILISLISINPFSESDSIYGEWISTNIEINLYIKISKSNEIHFDSYPKKENSLYPQKFNFTKKDNHIFLANKKGHVDTIQVISNLKNELELYFLPDKNVIKFYRFKKNSKVTEKKRFKLSTLFVSNYRNETSLDTIIVESDTQFKLSNNSICEYSNIDSINYYNLAEIVILQVNYDKDHMNIFVEEFGENYVKGISFKDGHKKKLTIRNLNDNWINKKASTSKNLLLGKWILFFEENEFIENNNQENKVVYIGHPVIEFKTDKKIEFSRKRKTEVGIWRLSKIMDKSYVVIKQDNHETWTEIIEINDKHLILRDVENCKYFLSENPKIKDYYLIKK